MIRITFAFLIVVFYASLTSSLFAGVEAEEFIYDSKEKRDPFIPLITEKTKYTSSLLEDAETIDDVILEGIVYDPAGNSIAILNGTVAEKGQVIGNVKVEDITENQVVLIINEMEYKLDFVEKGDEKW